MTRALWARLHRYLGLATAAFLAVAGLTGSLIAFQAELDTWLNPRLFKVDPARVALPLDRLVAAVEAADRQVAVLAVAPGAQPGRSALVTVEPRIDPATGSPFPERYNQAFVDPATGAVLGTRLYGAARLDRAHLLPFIVMLHYSLHMPDRWGDLLLGIVAMAWLIDCFIGFYLTLPARAARSGKSWWQRWRPAWRIKSGASVSRLNFDLHRAGGLWLWALLLVLALTSIAMNLRREVFVPVVQRFGPVTPHPLEVLPRVEGPAPVQRGWDMAVEAARRHAPPAARDWPVRGVQFIAAQRAYEVGLMEPGGRLGSERLFVRADNGASLARLSYDDGTSADKFLAWQYPLHSGQIGGLAGRIVVCLLGVAVFAFSITGVVIWALKRRGRRVRVTRQSQEGAPSVRRESRGFPAATDGHCA